VVNREGGSGALGTNYVAKAKKDGYTLLAGPSSSLVIMPIVSKEFNYDPINDFAPLGYLGFVPSTIAVRADSPFKTLQELIEYAKKNPGKLKNAHAGIGTESYINLEYLCYYSKIKINSIPFEGGSAALPALLGGHVDMASLSLTTMGPQFKGGKVRGLAITSKTRDPEFPDIPTTTELGHPYANIRVWHAAFAPAGVPQSVLNVLIPAVEKVFKNPEVVQRAQKVSLTVEYMGPGELRKRIESEIEVFKKIAEAANLIQ
jgi:tripartite-type tricarboxylate transporter receptor subunit TctC